MIGGGCKPRVHQHHVTTAGCHARSRAVRSAGTAVREDSSAPAGLWSLVGISQGSNSSRDQMHTAPMQCLEQQLWMFDSACCALQIVIGGRDKYSINGHAAQQG